MTTRFTRTMTLIAVTILAHAPAGAIAETTAARACADAVRTPDYPVIADACGRAAAASPAPAFLLWAGVARVELVWAEAIAAEARRTGRPSNEVTVPPSTDFTEARAFLDRAVAAEPRLWRAHYYLGRIYRANGDDRSAAQSFTRAIYANPQLGPLYVALAVLYDRWGYSELAMQVAAMGTERVSDRLYRSKLFYLVATSRYDLGLRDLALADIDQALAEDASNQRARFTRGQWLAAAGRHAEAKADLEAVVKNPPDAFVRAAAERWLKRIASER